MKPTSQGRLSHAHDYYQQNDRKEGSMKPKRCFYVSLMILFLVLAIHPLSAGAGVFDDLQDLIAFLNQKGELITVNKAVSSEFEAAAVQSKILNEAGKAVLFTNIDGKGKKMLGNIYTSRKMLSYMFDVEPGKLVDKVLSYKSSQRFPPKFVDSGPCQEVVEKEFKDILDIVPIPWNYDKDGNRYVTAGIVVTKDPETGRINTAIQRLMYAGGKKLNIFFAPMQRNWMAFNKYKAMKKDMPVAVIIGADPILMFASESSGIPYEKTKFEYAGAMMGKPIDVVKCKTVDQYVPAHAEYIIEGTIPWDKTTMEGPMGENQRVYGQPEKNPFIEVSCITHRNNPVYQNILPGTSEEHSLLAVPMEAKILERLREISPLVITLNLLPNFMNCVIKLNDYPPVQRGLGKNILLAALADPWVKYAVVVNKDVNIDDPNEVNWAISTRADLSRDLLLIEKTWGFVMDPSRKDRTQPVTKLGIDTTVDPLEKDRFIKADVRGYDKVNLKDYLGK
jgi:2,5-furandicarboxylate decarboxylase 1